MSIQPRRTDATGRSTGRELKIGLGKKWEMEGAYVRLPLHLLQSPAYRALTIPARGCLDFLMIEHLTHGGAENGNLMAPYRQLAASGVRKDSISEALHMLEAFGVIERTQYGGRQGGRANASRYGLGWLPLRGEPVPRERYRKITVEQVAAHASELKREREAARSKRAALRLAEQNKRSPSNGGQTAPQMRGKAA